MAASLQLTTVPARVLIHIRVTNKLLILAYDWQIWKTHTWQILNETLSSWLKVTNLRTTKQTNIVFLLAGLAEMESGCPQCCCGHIHLLHRQLLLRRQLKILREHPAPWRVQEFSGWVLGVKSTMLVGTGVEMGHISKLGNFNEKHHRWKVGRKVYENCPK